MNRSRNAIQATHYEIKKLSAANWQAPDVATETWRAMTAAAKVEKDWLRYFLAPTLGSGVPMELAKLLEVAKGVMIYSWYFYPLATLGAEQCFRLYDTATRIRCEQLGIPTKAVTKKGVEKDIPFGENIKSLVKRGIIQEADQFRWDAIRELRNSSSHPGRQTILTPGDAQMILRVVVELLNDLFQ